jgi:hypothetical protein
MAGGYIIDPATGMPAVQTAGGGFMPLPLSDDELRAAGAQLGPMGPPAPGPDLRVAGPGGGGSMDLGDAPPDPGVFAAQDQAAQVAAMRAQLAPQQPAANEHPTRAQEPGWMPTGQGAPSAPARMNPADLAQHRQAPSQADQNTEQGSGGINDPLVRQAMEEAMRGGGGGGGPRGLGVTGQTLKYKQAGHVPEEVSAAAREAQGASDAYNEQLAMSLNTRQQQAYEATQSEFAARAGQLQAVAERQAEQRRMLGDYEAKRDAVAAEAAQLKAPQMEEYWGSRSTTAKMATAISIALGGALQGLRGGQNPGLEMSNQEIERWIAGKREEYSRARDKVSDADSQYGRMVRMFESENLAEQHLREQAYTVRDAMLKDYAARIGTPSALEAYNQAALQTEAQRAALRQQAYADAGAEVEEKLSMQGGGGGRPKGVLDMLRAGAEAKGLRDRIEGQDGKPAFQREVQNEKVEGITGALEAIEAADEVESALGRLGGDSDIDDPLRGAWDSTLGNIPGTEARATKQRLQQQTRLLARGIQKSLGKSDNDAKLADEMAEGGGAVSQRRMAAKTARQKAIGSLQTTISSLTPDQQQSLLRSLEANSPTRAAQVRAAIAAVGTPQRAASEQVVQ